MTRFWKMVASSAFVMVLVVVVGTAVAQAGPDGKSGEQAKKVDFATAGPKCPVMDDPISFFVSTETDEGPVYFCCEDCVKKFKADPKKYAAKVATQRAALAKLAKVQVKCPISGKPVDRKISTDHKGEKLYFCCQGCVGRFEKDPAKYKAALAGSYSYQTTCPVMGGKIDPKSFTELPTGETIYYCCMGCDSKLLAKPAKYNKKLLAQGIKVNWAKVKAAKSDDGHAHDHGNGHDGHDH